MVVQVPLAGLIVPAGTKRRRNHSLHLRRAPCRWAAASLCEETARWRGCQWHSRSRSPDRRVPARERARTCCHTACDEHLAVGQQGCRVTRVRCRLPVALQVPRAGSYSSALARGAAGGAKSACDEHLAVGQQRRRVTIACGGEAASGTPGPAGRIYSSAYIGVTSCDEHLAVGQQRRRERNVER